MDINVSDVKNLREMTGAGIMSCKKALKESGGDVNEAIKILRQSGLASAEKKASRTAADGIVSGYVDPGKKVGALVEVNCETDFVAMSPEFKEFVSNLNKVIVNEKPSSIEDLYGKSVKSKKTVKEIVTQMINKFGENIDIRRYECFTIKETGVVDFYVHSDMFSSGKVGAMIEVGVKNQETLNQPEFKEFVKDLLMQIVASKPKYVDRHEVPKEIVEREMEIYKVQSINSGKPQVILDKIINGKLEKFFEDTCILEQVSVKDDKKTISELIMEMNRKIDNNENISIIKFARYEKGEGIENKKNDFVEEVMSQIKK